MFGANCQGTRIAGTSTTASIQCDFPQISSYELVGKIATDPLTVVVERQIEFEGSTYFCMSLVAVDHLPDFGDLLTTNDLDTGNFTIDGLPYPSDVLFTAYPEPINY
jgi:hypothetical protein